ncbi:MAG: PD-(D/E)XK nuclease family transposase [Bilifractor sp.]|jgi:hypothetical protein
MEKAANQLGRVLYDTSQNSALDMAVKKILSQRPILAFILKNAVSDFQKFSMDEIQAMIDTPHISSIAVNPGSTNDMITGEPKDYGETGEGLTVYDIRFDAAISGTEEGVTYDVMIDVEAQANQYKPYDMETRGIAYCCRMISEQMGRDAKNSHYEKLRKVYSIWICMNCSQKDANTVSEYQIQKVRQVGNYTKNPRTDLLRVVMIRLPKDDGQEKAQNHATRITEMLSTLLSKKISPADKIQDLEEKYGIQATEGIREEVSSMCNYSDYIFSEGEKKGLDKGVILGAIDIMRDDGISEDRILSRIMKRYQISEDDAKRLMDEEKELI